MTETYRQEAPAPTRFTLDVLDAHAGGNPTRVVTGGLPDLGGKNVREMRDSFAQDFDRLRTALVLEPRGGALTSAAVVVKPGNPKADLGLFYMEAHGYLDMCGSDTIAAVTVLLESGEVPLNEPLTRLTVETPAGLVDVESIVSAKRVRSVTFTNAPAHCVALDVELILSDRHVVGDVAWGGNYFFIVDGDRLGFDVHADVHIARELGTAILHEFRRSPEPTLRCVDHVLFHNAPPDADGEPTPLVVIVYPGTTDRSPCGTGTTARIAALVARGAMTEGDTLTHRGPTGETFTGTTKSIDLTASTPTVTVQITGRAFLTGSGQVHVYDDDPLGAGFIVTDYSPPQPAL